MLSRSLLAVAEAGISKRRRCPMSSSLVVGVLQAPIPRTSMARAIMAQRAEGL